jgi:hypothetical protein
VWYDEFMNRSYLVRTEPFDSATPQIWVYIGLVILLAYAVNALLLGRIFAKAGRENWRAWIPFWNIWEFFRIGGFCIQAKLGKPWPFIFLIFVNLVAPLWLWILALDGSKWSKKSLKRNKK